VRLRSALELAGHLWTTQRVAREERQEGRCEAHSPACTLLGITLHPRCRPQRSSTCGKGEVAVLFALKACPLIAALLLFPDHHPPTCAGVFLTRAAISLTSGSSRGCGVPGGRPIIARGWQGWKGMARMRAKEGESGRRSCGKAQAQVVMIWPITPNHHHLSLHLATASTSNFVCTVRGSGQLQAVGGWLEPLSCHACHACLRVGQVNTQASMACMARRACTRCWIGGHSASALVRAGRHGVSTSLCLLSTHYKWVVRTRAVRCAERAVGCHMHLVGEERVQKVLLTEGMHLVVECPVCARSVQALEGSEQQQHSCAACRQGGARRFGLQQAPAVVAAPTHLVGFGKLQHCLIPENRVGLDLWGGICMQGQLQRAQPSCPTLIQPQPDSSSPITREPQL